MRPSIIISQKDESLDEQLITILKSQGFSVIGAQVEIESINLVHSKKLGNEATDAPEGKSRKKSLNTAVKVPITDIDIPIIVITKNGSKTQTLAILKARVYDHFTNPFSYQDIAESIKESLSGFSENDKIKNFNESCTLENGDKIIGNSMPMQEVKNYIKKVAKTDSTVLITGETGTGKELVAELIHKNSSRQDDPFVSINCTALPENLVESELFGYEKGAFTGADSLMQGKFEQAMGGTVFLDEIGDMSLVSQAKILRTIEKKEVYRLGGKASIPLNFRLIAATNKDLESLVAEGKFRNDLYYRLNIARIHLPSLVERKEDIPILIVYFIKELNNRFGREVKRFSKKAENFLFRYSWPGNVRELKNLIEASFINLPTKNVSVMDLPKQLQNSICKPECLTIDERKKIVYALLETKWNKSKAAEKLNWSRMTIYRKMTQYNIVESRNPRR